MPTLKPLCTIVDQNNIFAYTVVGEYDTDVVPRRSMTTDNLDKASRLLKTANKALARSIEINKDIKLKDLILEHDRIYVRTRRTQLQETKLRIIKLVAEEVDI